MEGDPDDSESIGVPGWFLAPGLAEPAGGPGFPSGGVTSTTTQLLDEGVYVIECAVIDEEGRFHSPFGMVEYIEVTGEAGKGSEPSPDIDVSIGCEEGITFEEQALNSGRYTVGTTFEDNTFYHHVLEHEGHLLLDVHSSLDGRRFPRGCHSPSGASPGELAGLWTLRQPSKEGWDVLGDPLGVAHTARAACDPHPRPG